MLGVPILFFFSFHSFILSVFSYTTHWVLTSTFLEAKTFTKDYRISFMRFLFSLNDFVYRFLEKKKILSESVQKIVARASTVLICILPLAILIPNYEYLFVIVGSSFFELQYFIQSKYFKADFSVE